MKILIIGSGYIGQALAKYLKANNHELTITTRDPHKISELSQYADRVMLLDLSHKLDGAILNNPDIIILAVAPTAQHDSYENTYLNSAHHLHQYVSSYHLPKQLLYTSSTSVYGDQNGNPTHEDSLLNIQNKYSAILLQTEQILQKIPTKVAILRLAEIYGPEREFINKIDSIKKKSNGKNYVNAVHRDDIVGAIDFLIQRTLEGVFNLACNEHPTRKQLYQQVQIKYNLEPLPWNDSINSRHGGNKIVTSDKLKNLGYTFKYPFLKF